MSAGELPPTQRDTELAGAVLTRILVAHPHLHHRDRMLVVEAAQVLALLLPEEHDGAPVWMDADEARGYAAGWEAARSAVGLS